MKKKTKQPKYRVGANIDPDEHYVSVTHKDCGQMFLVDTLNYAEAENHLRNDIEHCPVCSKRMPLMLNKVYHERLDGIVIAYPVENFAKKD
jgi:hypothetical protein